MKKILITTNSCFKEFTNSLEAKAYKMCLIKSKIDFNEYELDTNQDIGLRGIEGYRYSVSRLKGELA